MSEKKDWNVTLRGDLNWYSDDGEIASIGPFRKEDSIKIAQMLNSSDEIRDLVADWLDNQDFFECMPYVQRQMKSKAHLMNTSQPYSEKALIFEECKKELELIDFRDTVEQEYRRLLD